MKVPGIESGYNRVLLVFIVLLAAFSLHAQLVVTTVREDSSAGTAGLIIGDRITAWHVTDGDPTPPGPLDLVVVELERGISGPVSLTLERDGASLELSLPPGKWKLDTRPAMLSPDQLEILVAVAADFDDGATDTAVSRLLDSMPQEPEMAGWWLLNGASMAAEHELWGVACKILASANDLKQLQHALLHMARGRYLRSDKRLDEAEHSFNAAVNAARLAKHPLVEAEAIRHLGLLTRSRGDLEQAAKLHGQSLALRRQYAPGSLAVAQSQTHIGIIAYFRGDLRSTEQCFSEALLISENLLPNSVKVARSLENLANVVSERGDFAAAEKLYVRSLTIKDAVTPDSLDVAGCHRNLGVLALDRGDFEAAQSHFEKALAIAKRLAPDSLAEAALLNNLGIVAMENGDLDRAAELHESSLAIKQNLAPNSIDVATSLNNLGSTAFRADDMEKAEKYFDRALTLKRQLADGSLLVASSLCNVAVTAARKGDLQRAEKLHGEALDLQRQLAPETVNEAFMLLQIARIERETGRQSEALKTLERALSIIELQTGHLGGRQESDALFRSRHQDIPIEYIDLLLELGMDEQAFDVLERSRAQSFLEMLAERELAFDIDLTPQLDLRRRRSASRLDRAIANLAGLSLTSPADQRQGALDELTAARREQNEVKAAVRATSPRIAALDDPTVLDLPQIRTALAPDTLLLAYAVHGPHAFLFMIGPGELPISAIRLDTNEERLRRSIDRFRTRILDQSSRTRLEDHAQNLGSLLLGPADQRIAQAGRLVIVPAGPLHLLSFAALRRPQSAGRWLVEDIALSTVASATVLAELKGRARSDKKGRVVAFGDADYGTIGSSGGVSRGAALVPLPASRDEATTVATAFHERSELWLGQEVTEERVLSLGSEFDVVHLAVHGVVDARFPLDSFLALSLPKDPQ